MFLSTNNGGTSMSIIATNVSSFEEIEAFLKKNYSAGDLLITMGAGDVVKIGENLLAD